MDLTIEKTQTMENTDLRKAASLMFLQGAGRKDVIDFLNENGVGEEDAEKMATSSYMAVKDQRKAIVEQQLGTQAQASGGSGGIVSILIGILLIGGGIAASMGTDRFFYGAILVGVITLFQGLFARNS